MKILWLFNIIVILGLVSGCAPRKVLAPVDDRNAPPSTKVVYHTVAAGETLYSIAWRYNLDYKKLAKANRIGHSYRIYPGQKIHLDTSKKSNPVAVSRTSLPKPSVKTQSKPPEKVGAKKPQERLTKKTPPSTSSKPLANKVTWTWPTRGRVLRGFSGKNGLSKGIDLGGNLGEPVRAASSGTVVYSGDGLRGYGKLIIIKHSDKYLSAYAHNRKLLVKEGDVVSGREKIAEMGKSGTNTVKLHFEIRFDGQPVDPLKYLPPK